MANDPIGITFIPSAANQAAGPQQGNVEGPGGSSLDQAFKILSLRLPQVLGAKAIAPSNLLSPSAGSASLPNGVNPNAAILQAMLKAMLGGMPPDAGLGATLPTGSPTGGRDTPPPVPSGTQPPPVPSSTPDPGVIFHSPQPPHSGPDTPNNAPTDTTSSTSPTSGGGGRGDRGPFTRGY